jgi:hypothetical protein
MANIKNSPYTAAMTGGGFLFEETDVLLPLLQSEDSESLLKDEAVNNRLLHINSEKARKTNMREIVRRYEAMSKSFWIDYSEMDENDRRIANLFAILKTYKILFDFHVNVTMRRWNSIAKSVSIDDIMMEFNEISARDEFVDSWAETTKKKVASAYLSILRKVKMMDNKNGLLPVSCNNFDYYLTHGEPWFLEACLLQPYQIESIKKRLL